MPTSPRTSFPDPKSFGGTPMALWLRPQSQIRCQPRSPGFLIARLHVPRATAPLDPWQRDVPCVDAPTFKNAPRSVRRELDNRPISMEFNQSPAIEAQVAAFFDRSDHTSPGRRPHSIHGNVTFPASTRRRSKTRRDPFAASSMTAQSRCSSTSRLAELAFKFFEKSIWRWRAQWSATPSGHARGNNAQKQ
jgi:hypothetical protein